MEVNCGSCITCRLDRSRMWAARISHETGLYNDLNGSCFITLTYRDPHECSAEQLAKGLHLPSDGSLHPSHLQKFLKRLRKKYGKRKIRYYAVGEYGDENGRPHYHAILFNVDFVDKMEFREEEGIWTYSSEELDSLWQYGFTTVGEANWETAAYCARYVMKKIGGAQAEEHYRRVDEECGYEYWIEPEFARMSLKPGIGARWFEKYERDFIEDDDCPVAGRGVQKKVPRYYAELYKRTGNYDAHVRAFEIEKMKEARCEYARSNPEYGTPLHLEAEYLNAKARKTMLARRL